MEVEVGGVEVIEVDKMLLLIEITIQIMYNVLQA